MSAEIVREWLESAQADLNAAWNCAHGPREALKVAPYHVQQAAEKLVKAVLVSEGIDPPYTHELGALLTLVRSRNWRKRCSNLSQLSIYSTAFRYPGEEAVEPVPSVPQIDGWIAEIEALKREFEIELARSLEQGDSG